MKLIKFIFITVFPLVVYGGGIGVIISDNNGESSYEVRSGSLRSELVFPFAFNTIGISTQHRIAYVSLTFEFSGLLDKRSKTGKDYDYQNNDLTIFSRSQNRIDNFIAIRLSAAKNLNKHLDFIASLKYQKLNNKWYNTIQTDFNRDQTIAIDGKTLEYKQNFYQFNIGVDYYHNLTNDIAISIKPSLIYAFINNEDRHLLRNFYTEQDSDAFGYGLAIAVTKMVAKQHSINFFLQHEFYRDKSNKIDYFTISSNTNYATLPASFEYKNTQFGIKYQFNY